MEITESSLSVFHMCKLLALAPISIQRNEKGVIEIKRSRIFSIYSIVLSLTMVILAYDSSDANCKFPLRTKSSTLKVITALDVTVVVLASGSAIACGLFSIKPTQELNSRLNKIDLALHSFSNFKNDRIKSIIIAMVPLMFSATIMGYDFYVWITLESKSGIKTCISWYLTFYGHYLIKIGFHVLYANTALGLGRRFRRLNKMLECNYFSDNSINDEKETPKNSMKITAENISTLHDSWNTKSLHKESCVKTRVALLKSLADNQESLGKCVQIFSRTFGLAILFILASCMMHLVLAAYFLLLALLSRNVTDYVWDQVIWIVLHILRLILVVEPCHIATTESKKTIEIMSELKREVSEPLLIEEIKKLWQQSVVLDVNFSALGLCRISRNILTSFSSAIATYLVILIQFQE